MKAKRNSVEAKKSAAEAASFQNLLKYEEEEHMFSTCTKKSEQNITMMRHRTEIKMLNQNSSNDEISKMSLLI